MTAREARKPDGIVARVVANMDVVVGVLVAALVLGATATLAENRADARGIELGRELSAAVLGLDRPGANEAGAKSLEKLANGNVGTSVGLAAGLVLAREDFEAGRYDAALRRYQAYLADNGGRDGLGLFVYEGIGYAAEAKGDLATARRAYQTLTNFGAPERAALHEARLLEKEGRTAEAREAYRRVVARFEHDLVATEARSRLVLMDVPAGADGGFEAAPAAPKAPPRVRSRLPGERSGDARVAGH